MGKSLYLLGPLLWFISPFLHYFSVWSILELEVYVLFSLFRITVNILKFQ